MRAETIAERRNVAANMRSAAERRKYDLQDDPDYSPFAALYAVFCGVRGFPRYKDILHLADLIDRPTCAIVESYMGDNLESVEEMPHHVLSCGHIAYGEDDPMFCPVCGAAVTDDYR